MVRFDDLKGRRWTTVDWAEWARRMEELGEERKKWSRWCNIVDPICAVLLVIAGALALWCIVFGAIILYPCLVGCLTAGE